MLFVNLRELMFKKENYNPLMFLAALWAGGMSVTFFMYLMFMTKHTNPIPTFDSLYAIFISTDSSIFIKGLIIFAIVWIIFFAFKHIQLVIWNLTRYFGFTKTKAYKKLKTWNGEVTLMALPLTLAMTVNVLFILWAVFIPNLWSVVEYLFPGALIAFAAIWYLSLSIFGEYFVRLITQKWNADFVENNNLAQLLSVFAFVMVWVGFAASAAMSQNEITAFLGLVGSIFFMTLAFGIWTLKLIVWFKAILKHWLDEAASPSLWIMIPILTLMWITFIRDMHWLHHFGWEMTSATLIILTTVIISLQAVFGFIGYKIMKKNKYFEKYIHWEEKSPGTFALICPWVALVVFAFFFLHLGLVKSGIVPKFEIAYFILLAPLVYLQFKTIFVMLKLNKKFGL